MTIKEHHSWKMKITTDVAAIVIDMKARVSQAGSERKETIYVELTVASSHFNSKIMRPS